MVLRLKYLYHPDNPMPWFSWRIKIQQQTKGIIHQTQQETYYMIDSTDLMELLLQLMHMIFGNMCTKHQENTLSVHPVR